MFVQSTEACGLHNSESPITQAEIDQQNAFIASVGTAFDDGDDALNALLQVLGGNPAGDTVDGAAGVPTTGTLDQYAGGIPVVPTAPNAPSQSILPSISDPSSWAWPNSPWPNPFAWAESPAAPIIVSGGGSGWRAPQGENWQANRRRYTNASRRRAPSPSSPVPANCPVLVPLVTTIPIPSYPAPVSPSLPPGVAPSAPTPAPLVPIPVPAALPDCRTGNYCIDIMRGCVLSSQVSAAQLQACSEAGYAGNENLFPAIAAAGGVLGGEYFGTPDPNPAPYGGSGMSGLGQSAQDVNAGIFSNAFEYIISGLVTVAALAIFSKSKKSR
jgi:hypothetical protein